jgi:lysylphosphatidylglycerol synthetase-like protein (DUF2156 family)
LILPTPFLHLAKGLDWEEAMICYALLAGLIFYRRSFYAENDKPSARQGIIGALAFFAFATIYGPIGFLLLRHQFRPHVTLERAVVQSTHLLLSVPDISVLQPRTHRAMWFEDTLLLISALAMSYGIVMLLRPVLPRGIIEEKERSEAQRLLHLWGGPPLAYFGLLPDKRFLFAPSVPTQTDTTEQKPGQWAVPYRVVCAGDSIGFRRSTRSPLATLRHLGMPG